MNDATARARSLDPQSSFIVQAPAGSGKTELLTQRLLCLLARVRAPEAVVAITFTKKAAAEMRQRVLKALTDAAGGGQPATPHAAVTRALAEGALETDAAFGWNLLDNPSRLRIQTIDSLCLDITAQMPWSSGLGAVPEIVEKADPLYREAAWNTLRGVASEEASGSRGPLSTLLLHLDNNFTAAAKQIAGMLEKRDQWLRMLGAGTVNLAAARANVERALKQFIADDLRRLRGRLSPALADSIRECMNWEKLPGTRAEDAPLWAAVAAELLTKGGTFRKKHPLCSRLERESGLESLLCDTGKLPPPEFADAQWQAMEAVIQVMPLAVAQLQAVFAERGCIDFAELSLRALQALGRADDPSELGLAVGERIEHLLVDEFQDTSYTQFELLRRLTAGWEAQDGRTLFLVGDPMQSIYRFRQAEVGLFFQAREEGIGAVALEPLSLTSNFRSPPALVDWVNRVFSGLMLAESEAGAGVSYHASEAQGGRGLEYECPVVHAFTGDSNLAEAERIANLIEKAEPGDDIAILVRTRAHLAHIVPALKQRGLRFQAIEIDELGERPVIQDLLALTFALSHLADRVSWLAVLRAPWCGLTLDDLHALVHDNSGATIWDTLQKPGALEPAAMARIERIVPILRDALAMRGRAPLRDVVEHAWIALGGPAVVTDSGAIEDASAYLDLLAATEEHGGLGDFKLLRKRVAELYAQPDCREDVRVQIMTVHKAKGLEFDTVILPGLGSQGGSDKNSLFLWTEQNGHLLLAPIAASEQDGDPLYRYLARSEREKAEAETVRLLYVAVTRARKQLHLTGCVNLAASGGLALPAAHTLLRLLWPHVHGHFERARASSFPAPVHDETAPRSIRRVPAGWATPAPPAPAIQPRYAAASAVTDAVTFDWVGDTLRHTGTTVHSFLQRIAREGLDRWDTVAVYAHRGAFRSMLANLGVIPAELREATAATERALLSVLRDERGRWILSAHEDAACELPLTGLLGGEVYQAILDRTFRDENGIRWIIDYKTSAHPGGDPQTFLDNEQIRYRAQLERYASLMAQRETAPIRLALYFPLLNGWLEWGAPTLKRKQASLFD